MTATAPDSHPDSPPAGPSEDIERADPTGNPGRDSIEETPDSAGSTSSAVPPTHDGSPLDPPGIEDGVAGTGGVNKSQEDVTS